MSVIKNIQEELSIKNGPLVKPLHSNDSFRSIIIGFNAKTTLKEHVAYWPSKLTVLEGAIDFVQEDEIIELNKYDTCEIEVGTLHLVNAKTASVCLLTQSKPND